MVALTYLDHQYGQEAWLDRGNFEGVRKKGIFFLQVHEL